MTNKLYSEDLSIVTGGNGDYSIDINLLKDIKNKIETNSFPQLKKDTKYNDLLNKFDEAIELASLGNRESFISKVNDIVNLLESLKRTYQVRYSLYNSFITMLCERYGIH